MNKRKKKKTLLCHVQKRGVEPILKYDVPQETVASAMEAVRQVMCVTTQTVKSVDQQAVLERLSDTIARVLHQQLESGLVKAAADISGDVLRHTLQCNVKISASLILANLIADLSEIFND